ncbi:MAG TPA: hypothetical protein VMB20_10125 [Candidatus Acidoferrum sp.]|nr:hypothetical protein [Candidatus Acidoferrum sp.]
MKRYHLGILGVIFAGMALMAVVSPADAVTASGTVDVKWHALPIVNFTLTPNYYSPYGAVLATFGTQPAPTTGPGASPGGGTVDFGKTLAGDTYLYKYAAHLHVTTNDSNGFTVYGEAATLITNTSDGSMYPAQALYYLPSGATSDSNTGFTPGLPFSPTSGMVTGGGDSIGSPPTITYATYPSPVAQTSLSNGDFYYDYQFKVPGTATNGNYYVWIVYTVVGQ